MTQIKLKQEVIVFIIIGCFFLHPINTSKGSNEINRVIIEEIGEIQTGGKPIDIQIVNDLMFVADHLGLFIYNISDPLNPQLIGQCHDTGSSHGIVVNDTFAFIADLDFGLEVYNITDLSHPRELISFHYGDDANELAIKNSVCFLLTDTKFISLNISDPLNIIQIDEYSIDGTFGLDFVIIETYAFLPEWPSGLLILDISDPSAIQLYKKHDLNYIRSFYYDGEYMYAACRTDGFKIYSISDPSKLELIGKYSDVGSEYGAYGVYKYSDYVLICDYDEGLKVIQISNPTAPCLIGFYAGTEFFGIDCMGNYAFILQGGDSIQIVELVEEISSDSSTSDSSSSDSSTSDYLFVVPLGLIILVLRKRECK